MSDVALSGEKNDEEQSYLRQTQATTAPTTVTTYNSTENGTWVETSATTEGFTTTAPTPAGTTLAPTTNEEAVPIDFTESTEEIPKDPLDIGNDLDFGLNETMLMNDTNTVDTVPFLPDDSGELNTTTPFDDTDVESGDVTESGTMPPSNASSIVTTGDVTESETMSPSNAPSISPSAGIPDALPMEDSKSFPSMSPSTSVDKEDTFTTPPTASATTVTYPPTSPVFPTYSILTLSPTAKKIITTPPPVAIQPGISTEPEKDDDDWFNDDRQDHGGDDSVSGDSSHVEGLNPVNITNMTLSELAVYEVEQNETMIIVASSLLGTLLLMVFTAYQVKENPTGLWAGCCRLLVMVFAFLCKIIFLPCYLICCRCGRQRDRANSQKVPVNEDYRGMGVDHDLNMELT